MAQYSYSSIAAKVKALTKAESLALRDSLGLWHEFPGNRIEPGATRLMKLSKSIAISSATKTKIAPHLLENLELKIKILHLQEKLKRRNITIEAVERNDKTREREGLRRLRKDFDRKLEAFGHFSHDLKTPFSMLISNAESLAIQGKEIPAKIRVRLENIRMGIHRVLRDAMNSLDAAQVLARKNRAKLARRNLSEFAQEVCDMYALIFESYAIRFSTSIEKNLFAEIDALQFEKILNNLLSNALKHGAPGGSTSVTVKSVQKAAHITIVNRGFGAHDASQEAEIRMKDENPWIFSSHGFGLLIVKKYMQQNKGKFSFKKMPDGASVELQLPLIKNDGSRLIEHTMQFTHRELEHLASERNKLSRRRG